LLISIAPATGQAQEVPKAFQTAYDAGQDAYNLGNYEEARAHFEKARRILPDAPGPFRWLAAVGFAQKRYEDCLNEAFGYLDRAPDGGYVPDVRTLHAQCRVALERAPFKGEYGGGGALAVTANVEGATLRINGLKYGATPLEPRAVAAGSIEITLEAEGYLGASREVKVLPEIVIDVHFELDKDPNWKPTEGGVRDDVTVGWVIFQIATPGATIAFADQPPAPGPNKKIEVLPGLYEVTVSAPGYESWRRRVRVVRGQKRLHAITLKQTSARRSERRMGYILLGAAVSLAATGTVFSLLEGAALEEAEDIWDVETSRPLLEPMLDLEPLHTREDLQEVTDRGERYRLYATISFGLAAAALGGSIYYFVKERPSERPGFELPVAVGPIPGGGGIAGVAATYTMEVDW
jgi:hypothetical protein